MRLNQLVEKFYQTEKVKSGRLFLRYLGLRNPEREKDAIIAYSYIRWLDDLVDCGINPDAAYCTLEQEEKLMKGLARGDKSDMESYPSLIHLHQKYGDIILGLFQKMIEVLSVDNEIIRTGNPLDEKSFAQRINHTLVPYEILSLIAFGRELEYTKEFTMLMQSWIYYDALRDLKEDLSAGLILFSKEELNHYGVNFKIGMPVPPSFRKMYDEVKRRTIRDLILYSSSVQGTNMPVLEKIALHGYFLLRPIKLAASKYPF